MVLHEWIARAAGLDLACVLDFEPDLAELRADLDRVLEQFAPLPHPAEYFNPSGGWRSLNLRSPGGALDATLASSDGPTAFTPAMDSAPATRELLARLGAPADRVRFLALEPRAEVGWHCGALSIDWRGEPKRPPLGRFHLPLHTNRQALLNLCGTIHRWDEGALCYADFSFPHRIENHGDETRFHLVLDLHATPELLDRFPTGFLEQRGRRNRLRPWCQRACALFYPHTSASSYLERHVR